MRRSAFTRVVPKKRARTVGAEMLKLKRQVKALTPEHKVFLNSITPIAPLSAVPTISYLNAIGQGSDSFNRIGDRIRILGFETRLHLDAILNNAAQNNTWFMIVKDLESNGVVPTVSGTAQAIFVGPLPQSTLIETSVRERFKVIAYYKFPGAMVDNGNQTGCVQKDFKQNVLCTFHDGGTGTTAAGKNAYYLVGVTDSAAAGGTFTFNYSIIYTDI